MSSLPRGVVAGLADCIRGMLHLRQLDREIQEAYLRQRKRSMGPLARRRQAEEPSEEELKKKSLIHMLKSRWTINVVFVLITIVSFNYAVLPSLVFLTSLISAKLVLVVQDTILPLLSTIFKGLWVIPLLILMEIINTKFYLDVSGLVCIIRRKQSSADRGSVSSVVADRVFSLAVLSVFMLQTRLIRFLPIGWLVEAAYLLHLSELYAFFAFEYRWCFEGLTFEQRLAEMEYNWNYFLGFGLPLALTTWLAPSWWISAFLMYIIFPLYIVSSQQARDFRRTRMAPLRLFRPAVWLVDFVFKLVCSRLMHSSRRPPVTRDS